jgi:hypothetical protein
MNGFAILSTVLMPFTLWTTVRLAKIFLQPTHLLLDHQSLVGIVFREGALSGCISIGPRKDGADFGDCGGAT